MRFMVLGCVSILGAAACGDDGAAVGDDTLSGDPTATLDDQLRRIADDEAAHGKLSAKADGVLPGFEDALDVDKPMIVIADSVAVPDYQRASGANGFSLGGTEFWQKWSGGKNPSYSYGDGTEAGRKCMQASAIRFQALMADPPATYGYALEHTNWTGSHFNWNDDFSPAEAYGRPSGATLWAWRTGLMKFISQTGKNGECYLVTRAQVEAAGAVCTQVGRDNGGEIQGCTVRAGEVDRVLAQYADLIAEINTPETPETPVTDPDAVHYEAAIADGGIAIPDASADGVSTTVSVDAAGAAGKVTVFVVIDHPYIGDLTVTLSHGDRTEVLHAQGGGADDNLALETVSEVFVGTDKAGEWTLKVSDDAAQDQGVLKRFAIAL